MLIEMKNAINLWKEAVWNAQNLVTSWAIANKICCINRGCNKIRNYWTPWLVLKVIQLKSLSMQDSYPVLQV